MLQASVSTTTSASKQLQMKRQALEFRITLMTIVIVVVFLVCNSFESLLFILHSQELLYRNIVENYLRPICDVLMVFNSSVNVFIYGTVSTQFRAAFYEMFSCLQIRVSERMSCKQLKSDNLQYNTLGRWVTGTNDTSTKRLMFQVLFFFIISCRVRALKTLYFYFCKVIKK